MSRGYQNQDYQNPYQSYGGYGPVAQVDVSERASFIAKTYLHLAGAVAAFLAIEVALFQTEAADALAKMFFARGAMGGIMLMVGFIAVSMVAQRMATSMTSVAIQYAGLALYVVLEALIFAPLLWFAVQLESARGADILGPAGMITMALFGGLTAVVFITRKDFSFMRSALWFGSIALLCIFVAAAIFQFSIGLWVMIGAAVLMCGWILYDTSNVLLHYNTQQYVAASLALFASLATLFWYVIQIVMELQSSD